MSSSTCTGPFCSIKMKEDEKKRKVEEEQTKKEEKSKADNEQYLKEAEERNREREKQERRKDEPITGVSSSAFSEVSNEEVMDSIAASNYQGTTDEVKEQSNEQRATCSLSQSQRNLPVSSNLQTKQSNSSTPSTPPVIILGLSTLPEEPPFNLPQLSAEKAAKIDALNLAAKRQEAENSKRERSSEWSTELGSGHSSVDLQDPESSKTDEQSIIFVQPTAQSTDENEDEEQRQQPDPIDLNAAPFVPPTPPPAESAQPGAEPVTGHVNVRMSTPSDEIKKKPFKTTKVLSPRAQRIRAETLARANQENSSFSLPGTSFNIRKKPQPEVESLTPPPATRRFSNQINELSHLRGPPLQTFGDQPESSTLPIDLRKSSGNDKLGSSNEMKAPIPRETTPPTPPTTREQTEPLSESSNQINRDHRRISQNLLVNRLLRQNQKINRNRNVSSPKSLK
ncbi:hypothetical protein CRE_05524 [Caenorhabditis remanei]|uniref:Uncharacterized protein n=1 Tax=Caenorhabditis remanei TaxID=31234 RepID=E3LZS0_CAERE|nr:hypothetical protein CRE_05524 [Caenorhabditis remanei]